MSYEEEFKKLNNEVYNRNKDREEPFIFYYDTLFRCHPTGDHFVSAMQIYNYDNLKATIQVLEDMKTKTNHEKALLESMKIDLEDRTKKYHKDMKRKFID